LRQEILEGLGWRIFRIWSTDWFADPGSETKKMIAWLHDVLGEAIRRMPQQPIAEENEREEKNRAVEASGTRAGGTSFACGTECGTYSGTGAIV
jgi:hypothetical protein